MDKKISVAVFIDLSKAFDSIENHPWKDVPVRSFACSPRWFWSYLADRWQYVRIGTTASLTALLTHY